MAKRWVFVLLIITFGVGAGVGGVLGVLGYVRMIGGSGEPSVTISAPTLSLAELATVTPAVNAEGTTIAQMGTQVAQIAPEISHDNNGYDLDALATAVSDGNAQVGTLAADERRRAINMPVAQSAARTLTRTPRATSTPRPTPTPSATPTPFATVLPRQTLFRIVPDESEVRFTLDETMLGDDLVVVGRTNQVAGDIIVDFTNPQNSRLGVIRINVRTLRTAEEGRNDAMRSDILLSARSEYEFSDFVPTALRGLPDTVTIGETITFQIDGTFTLRGVTNPVTFEATVTPISEDELHGHAEAVVQRSAYGILDTRFLGGDITYVSEDVRLEIDFVARAVEST
jgi:polyisoprenoid-binding protein YceI